MLYSRDGLTEECSLAIAALQAAERGDRDELSAIILDLWRSFLDRNACVSEDVTATHRGLFVRAHPAAAGPLAAYEAGLARVVGGRIAGEGVGRWLDPANRPGLVELARAAAAVIAALRGEAAATSFDPTDDAALARELWRGRPRLPRPRPMQARLVEFMVGKDSATVEDVAESVHEHEETDARTVAKNVQATSDSAVTLGFRLVYICGSGRVFKYVSPE